jgi:hypothetical protein
MNVKNLFKLREEHDLIDNQIFRKNIFFVFYSEMKLILLNFRK